MLPKWGVTKTLLGTSGPRRLQRLNLGEENTLEPWETEFLELDLNPQLQDKGILGPAHRASLVVISLKDPARFPNEIQHSFKIEAREKYSP